MKTNTAKLENFRFFQDSVIIFIIIHLLQIPLFSQISGTSTIGPGGDYTTFTEAVNVLNTQGVNGPVIFNVLSGTYNEQFTINNITGSSSDNNVIFQSQVGDSATVVLQWASTSTEDNYVVTIAGGKYITFRGMTFKAMGTDYGTLVELKGNATNITFNNNLFLGLEATDGTYNKSILSGDAKTLTNIIIKNNRFNFGSQAIFLQGWNDGYIMGAEITGNIMTHSGFAGVRTNWVFAPVVTGNEINSRKNGIYVRNELGPGEYSYNRITANIAGIDLQRRETNPQKARITNNFISVISPTESYGITLPNTVMTEIYHNSVYIRSKCIVSAALHADNGTDIAGVVIRNNNLVNEYSGYSLLIVKPVVMTAMSHNNLYSEGNYIAKWGDEDLADLYDLQAVSGMNENSLTVYPHYVSNTDLHTSAPWLDGKGTPLPDAGNDFDGDPRHPVNPDIGADEFTSDPEYHTKLSGTYTIGANGYYKDFSSAMNDALLRGISGPVVYDIQSGSYNEQIKILNIPGSSSVNTVTFRPETGNRGDVQISFASTSPTENYVISCYASDFIRLENLSVIATGSEYATVINLFRSCDSIVIENNWLEGKSVNDGNKDVLIINADSSYFRSRIIKGNIMNNGSYGIYMRRESWDALYNKGAVIEDNIITGAGYCGIYVQFHETPLIMRNTVSAKSKGIELRSCSGPAVISGNKINSVLQEGLSIITCEATTNDRGMVVNNFIQAGGTSEAAGIFLNTAEHYSILYNSVNITSSYPTAKAFYIASGSSTRVIVKNNIFFNKGGAYAYYVTNTSTVVESDYNDLYTTSGPLAYWAGNYTDLASLSGASGMDLHSISANPEFVSDTDLHTTAAQLDGKATPLSEVNRDIDNRRRDAINPDIGAVEFGPITNHNPVAVNDTTMTLTNQEVTINVLANDSDPDGDNIKIAETGNGQHGLVEVDPTGLVLSYTSSAGFAGADSFIYHISDDFGLTDSAYVFVTVDPLPPFSLTDIKIIDLSHSSVAWGDYDDDGDLDILITGWLGTYDNYASRIYQNIDGKFMDSGILLEGLSSGTSHSAEWMDLDNDNDLDIIITGRLTNSSLNVRTLIYENVDGKFTHSEQPDLIDLTEGSVDWSDFNHDGKYDLLISGDAEGASYHTHIYENTGPDDNENWKLRLYDAELEGIWSGESMWVDFDSDRQTDIFVCGFGADTVKLYHNNNGTFNSQHTNLPSIGNSACNWGDFDFDGDMDLALIGKSGDDYLTKIYRNDGFVGKVYTFTDIEAGLVQVCSGDVAWGDFDNDGDLDLAYCGNTGVLTSTTKLYENVNGVFKEKDAPFHDMGRSTLAWGDYDRDGDLDLIVAGFCTSLGRPLTAVYRNNHDQPGEPPSSPVNLDTTLQVDGSVLLRWEPPDAGFGKDPGPLTFNLRIGTEKSGINIYSPMADVISGLRKISGYGNVELSGSWLASGLVPGKTYYWSVQTVDMSFRGSEFASEQVLYIPLSPEPQIAITPKVLDFVSENAGDTTSARKVTVSNTGSKDLVITDVEITGSDPDHFSIATNSCTVLGSGDTCYVEVIFHPLSAETKQAQLSVTSNDPANPVSEISLTGTGLKAIVMDRGSQTFGEVFLGDSAINIWTLKNTGNAILEVQQIYFQEGKTEDFHFADLSEFPFNINPGDSVNFKVVFKPNYAGERSVIMKIIGSDVELTRTLSGTGVVPTFSIAGQGRLPDNTVVTDGRIFVFELNENGRAVMGYSVSFRDAQSFIIINIPRANITMRFNPDKVLFPGYLSTYLGNTTRYNEAESFFLSHDTSGIIITLVAAPPHPTGFSIVRGYLLTAGKKSTLADQQGQNNGNGTPLPDVPVYLVDQDGEIIVYDITDNEGSFTFTNLEQGTYKFLADYMGYPMDVANNNLVVTADNQEFNIAAMVFGEEITAQITLVAVPETEMGNRMVRMYPNPAGKIIYIDIPGNDIREMDCKILNMSGEVMLESKLDAGINRLDLAMIPSGVYFIRFTSGSFTKTLKLVRY
jgi:hypothetical protein